MFKLHIPNFKNLIKKKEKKITETTEQKTRNSEKGSSETENQKFPEQKKIKPKLNIFGFFKKKKTEKKEQRHAAYEALNVPEADAEKYLKPE